VLLTNCIYQKRLIPFDIYYIFIKIMNLDMGFKKNKIHKDIDRIL